jgi:hypothetical protein
MKTNIIGRESDPKVHREYFLDEFKKRFANLNFKEGSEQKGKEEQIILTIQSPSADLGSLEIYLNKYEITISIPKITFHSHFDAIDSIHHLAPDADPNIPTRINALDFLTRFIEESVFIRCYKRKGKIEKTEIIDSRTGVSKESLSTLSRPLKRIFLKYDKEDYYRTGKKKR